jgi:urease accessory protein
MNKKSIRVGFLAALLLVFAMPVFAHTEIGATHAFMAGFVHPWSGIDHLLVMFAIGLWGYMLSGKHLCCVPPMVFLLFTAIGAGVGFTDFILPYAELWVSLSVLVFGLVISVNWQVPTVWVTSLAAIVALFHGNVHAVEIPKDANQLEYALGFLLSTAILHSIGVATGLLGAKAFSFVRIGFGLICASIGVLLLVG